MMLMRLRGIQIYHGAEKNSRVVENFEIEI